MIKVFNYIKNLFLPKTSSFSFDSLINRLNEAEQRPVHFFSKREDLSFLDLLQEAESAPKKLLLLQRLIALKYRLEGVNGGLDPTHFQHEAFEFIHEEARTWKKAHPLIGKSILSAADLNHLKKSATYPQFIELLKKFPELKGRFFDWVLRDGNDVVPFIEFPETCDRIVGANLAGRVFSLQIIKRDGLKILCLPFEGQLLSILDPNEKVIFRGNYELTIGDVFEVFTKKDISVGNLEFMREGIVNWNIHKLGYWNADLQKYIQIELFKKEWWRQMPPLELLNRRQVQKRYGMAINDRGWIAAAVATRGRPNLDYDGTHAFLEIAIPLGDGTYSIYDFGKLATEYPDGTLARLLMLTKTVHAAVAYPDDNVYFTQRQRGFHPFALNYAQGARLMDLIKQDILEARENNLIYQIESENCAKWVYFKLAGAIGEKNVPDFFRIQLLDTEPEGVISHLFYGIKQLPDSWQVPLLTFLHLPLGAARTIWIEENGEQTAKSLSRHSFFDTGQIYLPALLVHKVMTAIIPIIVKVFAYYKSRLTSSCVFLEKKHLKYLDAHRNRSPQRFPYAIIL